MHRISRTYSGVLAGLVVVGIAVGALLNLIDQRTRRVDAQLPLDTRLPIVVPHDLGPLKTELSGVEWSDGIFRGEVVDVSASAYNTLNGQYTPDVEMWNGDDLIEQFTPHRYFTVTFAVSEWWKNPAGIATPVHVMVHGYSPADPPGLAVMPDEVVYADDYGHTWAVGDDVVAMIIRDDLLGREMYKTTLQLVYFVATDGTLANVASSMIARSSTLSELEAVVNP
jgi:hypothetical protein